MGIFKNNNLINPIIGNKKVNAVFKNGKCIYRHEDNLLNKLILKNSVIHEGNPDFSQTATTDEGLWSLPDDYGTSYYYRGAVENNYVKFGIDKDGNDMYWRVIRINGDGSIRMLYDGTQIWPNANGTTIFRNSGDNRFIKIDQPWNTKIDDAKYVGWMFGGAKGIASTSKEQAQTNETDSDIKTVVDTWYKKNIVDTGYHNYIADEIFCNDRSIPGKSESHSEWDTGLGYGKNATIFGAYTRDSSKTPTFVCLQENDKFTVRKESGGNGNLTYPVGLITADEIVAAGGRSGYANNYYYYLYRHSDYSTWSMTPRCYGDSNPNMLNVGSMFLSDLHGRLGTNSLDFEHGVSPVINLKKSTKVTGTGTKDDPYVVI